jgi:hypothetical protein
MPRDHVRAEHSHVLPIRVERRYFELLNVRAKLAVENNEKVRYI